MNIFKFYYGYINYNNFITLNIGEDKTFSIKVELYV